MSFSDPIAPEVVKALKANLFQWVRSVWKRGEEIPEGSVHLVSLAERNEEGNWREHFYRRDKIFTTAARLQVEGLKWEQAKKVLVLVIDTAGVYGEEVLY